MSSTTQHYFDEVQGRIRAARVRGDLPVAPIDGLPVKAGPMPTPPQEPTEALPGLFDLWMVQREQQAAIAELQKQHQQRKTEMAYTAANLGALALKALLAASIAVGVTVGLAGAMLALLRWAN